MEPDLAAGCYPGAEQHLEAQQAEPTYPQVVWVRTRQGGAMALLIPDPQAALRHLAERPVEVDLQAALRYQRAEYQRWAVCWRLAGYRHLLTGL